MTLRWPAGEKVRDDDRPVRRRGLSCEQTGHQRTERRQTLQYLDLPSDSIVSDRETPYHDLVPAVGRHACSCVLSAVQDPCEPQTSLEEK
jgi:hypothetical protein